MKKIGYYHTYKLSERNLKNAMKYKADDETVSAMLDGSNAILASEMQFSDSQREVLSSRAGSDAPSRYPLFLRGYTADAVLNAAIGSPDSCSRMSRETDLDWIRKVGPQGARFSPDYLFSFLLTYYDRTKSITHQFNFSAMTRKQRQAASAVKQWLIDNIGYKTLIPLTWDEAVDVVTAKVAACWPLGGQKNSPEVREWLRKHPYDVNGATALVGQRFQRNKHDEDGNPVPRLIFNMDIRAVVLAAMYEVPLVKALQQLSCTAADSPYSELNGPEAVGTAICQWVGSSKLIEYDSIEVDVRSMDTAFTIEHTKLVYDTIKDLYSDSTYLWQSMELEHTCPSVLTERLTLTGVHSEYSGGTWTHMKESILSHIMQTELAHSARFVTRDTSGKPSKIMGLDNYAKPKILIAGDDASLLIKRPTSVSYCGKGPEEIDIRETAVKVYELWGMPTATEKVNVRRMYVNFCSKTYSNKAVTLAADGSVLRYNPVYSPVAAVLNVMYPEYALTAPSIMNEIVRVAAIVDQAYGSEHWDALVTTLVNSMDKKDVETLTAMMDSFDAHCEDAFAALGKAASWTLVLNEWAPNKSQFLQFLTKWLGLSTSAQADLRQIITDVVRFRVLHWKYRIDPEVIGHTYVFHGQEAMVMDRYLTMFEDTVTLTENGKTLLKPKFERLMEFLQTTPDGDPAPVRVAANYRADIAFDAQFEVDDPMTQFGRKPLEQSANVTTRTVDGVTIIDGNYWDD